MIRPSTYAPWACAVLGLVVVWLYTSDAEARESAPNEAWQIRVEVDPMTDSITRSLSSSGTPLDGFGFATIIVSCDNDSEQIVGIIPSTGKSSTSPPLVRFAGLSPETLGDDSGNASVLLDGQEALDFIRSMNQGGPLLVRFFARHGYATYEFELDYFDEKYSATCSTHPDFDFTQNVETVSNP